MSQARVTDFFSQRKKGVAGPVKASKQRGTGVACTRSRSAKNKEQQLCSSSIHEEFVRVIDEAAGLSEKECANSGKDLLSSPRTPKRTSAEFDLGTAVFSATADHSTAKKRRSAEAAEEAPVRVPEKVTKKKARKKLVLPQDPPQALPSEVTYQSAAAVSPGPSSSTESHSSLQTHSCPAVVRPTRGQVSKPVSKESLAILKARLQRIKKHGEDQTSTVPTPSVSTSSSTTPTVTNGHVPQTAMLSSSDAKALKKTVARAKELAEKTQRRKEEREAEKSQQSDTPSQDSTEHPAYQRYHTLAQATPPGLSLPFQYKVLAEMFRSMDTVVAMLFNRSETATFSKIKQGVQDMMHKRFEESHMGQIKAVFPQAYVFRQEKNVPTFSNSIKKGSYQLTVEPVIVSDQKQARPILSASCLLDRRHIFHQNLVSIVKQHHKVFLSLLVPPMSVPEDKLSRWHPSFNVDTVPAITCSPLPQPPHSEKLSTAQEVLDRARSLITPKMEKALVSLTLKTEEKTESKEPSPPQNAEVPQTAATPVPAVLKGVSQSLLDRIRAKEAQKIQAAMTRNSAQEERLLMMSRLPELARILRTVFVGEKKPALIMEVACNRMVASYRSALSTGDMEKHIRLLAEVAAGWLTIHPVRKDFYLKMNKNMELSIVLDKLSSRLKEEERL
ncbi:uncharacterized protein V6R79_023298 [Siganus canaliculatus]